MFANLFTKNNNSNIFQFKNDLVSDMSVASAHVGSGSGAGAGLIPAL